MHSPATGAPTPGNSNEISPVDHRTLDRQKEKPDAVCFTAGVPAATFAAGVIHAYLASNRNPPAVVAGISMGALSAAAMQRSYFELGRARASAIKNGIPANAVEAESEPGRWEWFRKYLDRLTQKPLQVIWDGLPNQSDFSADRIPVTDPTASLLGDREVASEFEDHERNARRDLYLFVKLGHWCSRLRVPLSSVVRTIVFYVRAKEKYPELLLRRKVSFWSTAALLALRLLIHVALTPKWFPEYKFRSRSSKRGGRFGTLLFGVLGKVVRALPVNHHPGLTWPRAWRQFAMDVFEAWKEGSGVEVVTGKAVLKMLGKRRVVWGFLQSVWYAIRDNFLWEAPVRPLLGWRIYGGSVILLLLLIGLPFLVWNVVIPRGIESYRMAKEVMLNARALEAEKALAFLQENRIELVGTALHAALQSDFVEQRPRLRAGLSWLQDRQQAYRGWVLPTFWLIAALVLVLAYQKRRTLLRLMLSKAELQRALVDDFHLRIALLRLFGTDGQSPPVGGKEGDGRIPMVIVAAPLQLIPPKEGAKKHKKKKNRASTSCGPGQTLR